MSSSKKNVAAGRESATGSSIGRRNFMEWRSAQPQAQVPPR
ncbi:MAG: hypothetical protein WDO56_00935 [Gammaproteobacteria bacterium]